MMSDYSEKKRKITTLNEEELKNGHSHSKRSVSHLNPALEEEINTFIKFYISIHSIVTLYDLSNAICLWKKVSTYTQLGIGSIFNNSEVQRFFQPPSSVTSFPAVTSNFVTSKIFSYLKENRDRPFNEDEFFRGLVSDAKIHNIRSTELCVKIQNIEQFVQSINLHVKKKEKEKEKEKERDVKIEDLRMSSSSTSSTLHTREKETKEKEKESLTGTELLKSHFSDFIDFFFKFETSNLKEVTILSLQRELFNYIQRITHIPKFRPFFAFLALVFSKYWKQNIDFKRTELAYFEFSKRLEKIMPDCNHFNDLQILQLAFTLDLNLPKYEEMGMFILNECDQLCFLVAKVLKGFWEYRITLVNDVLLLKNSGYDKRQILENIFNFYMTQDTLNKHKTTATAHKTPHHKKEENHTYKDQESYPHFYKDSYSYPVPPPLFYQEEYYPYFHPMFVTPMAMSKKETRRDDLDFERIEMDYGGDHRVQYLAKHHPKKMQMIDQF